MHEVTPSAVALADRILIDVWMANFQISFLSFILVYCLLSRRSIFKGHTELERCDFCGTLELVHVASGWVGVAAAAVISWALTTILAWVLVAILSGIIT